MTMMDDDGNTNKNEEMKIIMPPAPKKEKEERRGSRTKQISKKGKLHFIHYRVWCFMMTTSLS